MAFIGEAGGDVLVDQYGNPLVTWKHRKGAERIDAKALREAMPDVAAAYTVTGEPTRTFLVK